MCVFSSPCSWLCLRLQHQLGDVLCYGVCRHVHQLHWDHGGSQHVRSGLLAGILGFGFYSSTSFLFTRCFVSPRPNHISLRSLVLSRSLNSLRDSFLSTSAGELKTPSISIPKGTIVAVLYTFIVYLLLFLLVSATCDRCGNVSSRSFTLRRETAIRTLTRRLPSCAPGLC